MGSGKWSKVSCRLILASKFIVGLDHQRRTSILNTFANDEEMGPIMCPDEKKYDSERFCVCGLLYGLKPRDHLEPQYISKLREEIIFQDRRASYWGSISFIKEKVQFSVIVTVSTPWGQGVFEGQSNVRSRVIEIVEYY